MASAAGHPLCQAARLLPCSWVFPYSFLEIMMDNLMPVITYLAITSVAAERVTDIFRRMLDRFYYTPSGLQLQLCSSVTGALICIASPPVFAALPPLNVYVLAVIVGLATSGGSSVWNELLQVLSNYRKSVQEIK